MKVFDYEHPEAGEHLGTLTIEVTDELIRDRVEAIESLQEWYLVDSPFGGRIASPTLLDNECLRIVDTRYARFGSIHAQAILAFP